MKIKILGSGGSIPLPKPLCKCRICKEARFKGKRYKRNGCSIYIDDIKSLFDTPEDIAHSLNENNISRIDNIFYSHLDPDHTMGIRVIESLRKNWLDVSPELNNLKPINVYGLDSVIQDINAMRNAYGSFLEYYEKEKNIIKVIKGEDIDISNFKIKLIPIVTDITSTMYLIEKDNIKIVYAPCDIKPLNLDYLYDIDLLIIGGVIPSRTIKNNFYIEDSNPLLDSLYTIDEIIKLKEEYRIKKVIITHIEEDWGLSYSDYKKLEQSLDNISFAYDGMNIEVGGRQKCLRKI